MHMSDALISPAVGGTLWVAALAVSRRSARQVEHHQPEDLPLMGVAGAFVFAAQMINVSIPGTGSSGHLGGGLLLASLLGPEAAFLILFVVLFIQAVFFADGGLLALGCNVINMGFFPAFVAYPLIRKALQAFPARVPRLAVIGAAVLGVELGALGVVTETALSGLASLHWKPFLIAFLPIHLAIGLLEGILTVAVLSFVLRLRPDRLTASQPVAASGNQRRTLLLFLLALVIAGGLSQVASSRPDGLEWSLSRARFEPEASLTLQDHVSPFPDYRLTDNQDNPALAGLVGVILTLGVLVGVLSVLRRRSTHSLRKGP